MAFEARHENVWACAGRRGISGSKQAVQRWILSNGSKFEYELDGWSSKLSQEDLTLTRITSGNTTLRV
jgi:hypothetical protein